MKFNKIVREGVKLATSGSVQMMIGGIVACVVPKTISLPAKAVYWVGSTVVAWFAGETLDSFVEDQLDGLEKDITEITELAAEVKESIKKDEMGA